MSDRARILIVDDEEAILETMAYTFEDEYDVLTATSARDALAVLDAQAPVATVITDQRIMWREGLVTRESRHIPLARVNTVSYTQNVWERIFGFGDMNIDSASDDGEINLIDVPKVDKTKALLYQLAEDDRSRRAGEGDGS